MADPKDVEKSAPAPSKAEKAANQQLRDELDALIAAASTMGDANDAARRFLEEHPELDA